MIQHYNIIVKGKVQGVWFRKYTLEKALELQLLGFVKNQPDGNVYIDVQGAEIAVNSFISWLKTEGSPLSKVNAIELHIPKTPKTYTDFQIIR